MILAEKGVLTEEETIEILTLGSDERIYLSSLAAVYDTAIYALKKQVPQKPISCKQYRGLCPCCGEFLAKESGKYCGNCGQKLDWG